MNISKGHSGLLKIFLLNLVKFHLVLGFQHPHFKFQKNLNMMQQTSASLVQGKARDVTVTERR